MHDFWRHALEFLTALAALLVALRTIRLAATKPLVRARVWVHAFNFAVTQVPLLLKEVAAIRAQVEPDSGKSLFDELMRQGKVQLQHGIELYQMGAYVDLIAQSIEKCIFLANQKGQWVRVNRAMSLTFQYPIEKLHGMEWVSCIHDADRDVFMRDWDRAIRDRRSFKRSVRLLRQDGVSLGVEFSAAPQPGNPELVEIGWCGSITVTDASNVRGTGGERA